MADFLINVVVNPAGAAVGGRAARRELTKIDQAAEKTKRLISGVFAVFAARAGIRILAEFGQSMSTVAAISGATADQLDVLTASAERLGATTRFTATQAAEGLLFLSRAGFEVEESLAAIQPTLTLAQAGALGLGRAADIASNVLQGFRLEAAKAGDVVDVLAFQANRSNTSVEQLGNALSFVAPVAASLNVSLRESAAAIGILSDAGIQGERAGTGLRRVLAELESPGSVFQKILRDLGLTTDDVRVSTVGLTQALINLSAVGLDATTGSLEAFGQRGGPAFDSLVSFVPALIEMQGALEGVGGFAQQVADTMDDNLNGALLRAKSALQAIILAIGRAFLAGALTAVFNNLAAAMRFAADNVEILIGVLGVLTLRVIPAAITAVAGLAVAIASFLGPLGIAAIVIGAAIGALVSFADEIKLSKDGFVTLRTVSVAAFEEMASVARSALDFVSEQFTALTETLSTLFGPAVTEMIKNLGELLPTFDDILAGAKNFVNNLIRLFTATNRIISLIFFDLGGVIVDTFVSAFNTVGDTVQQFLIAIKNFSFDDFEFPEFSAPESLKAFAAQVNTIFVEEFGKDFIGEFGDIVNPILDRIEARAREIGMAAAAGAGSAVTAAESGVLEPIRIETSDAAFRGIIALLEQETQLLLLNQRERERRTELIRLEEELGRPLTAIERVHLDLLLQQNQAYADQAAILQEIVGPQQAFADGQVAINALLERGAITTEQAAAALRALQIAALETDLTFQGGFTRGLLRIQDRIADVATQVEGVLVNSFNKATDALTEFVNTGKLNFRSFVSSILSDLARLASQQVVGAIFGALFGGLGGTAGSGAPLPLNLEGFRHGGEFTVGGSGGPDSQLVAFRASPRERVSISPSGRGGSRVEFNIVNDVSNFRGSREDFPELQRLIEDNNEQLVARIKQDLKLGNFI